MLNYFKSTNVFNEKTCPNSILTSHKVNNGFFGILNVLSGNLIFIYDDTNTAYKMIGNAVPVNLAYEI
ncbi:MAG: DUF1971 domain-containing protein, partial [Ureaplasma sp.]|nr:DUF1971 domain-containing protein [Ureaplasma sp.]